MTDILVAGLINLETTLKIDRFPYDYAPVRYPFFGVNSSVSGVGYNVAKALNTLGHNTHFLSLIGNNQPATLVRQELKLSKIDDKHVLGHLNNTPQSVVIYDSHGQRAVNVDLKDIQERHYPAAIYEDALSKVDLAVLCNINFSRPMLKVAKHAGLPIATDVHAIARIKDDYNHDYMKYATVLFQSHENLPMWPEDWIHELWNHYGTPIAVIGLGHEGAILGVKDDNFIERVPSVYTREVVNTIGSGDALFSSFVHTYVTTGDPYLAIRKAVVFASYKIGVAGAADGFLNAADLDHWYAKIWQSPNGHQE